MKRAAAVLMVVARLAVGVLLVGGIASADEQKMVGVVTSIQLAQDGRSAVATLKDTKTEQSVDITVVDELTLDKFKDHRIVEGDEIRCKYEVKDGKNVSTYFRKTAGC